jgi:hypothetical protein
MREMHSEKLNNLSKIEQTVKNKQRSLIPKVAFLPVWLVEHCKEYPEKSTSTRIPNSYLYRHRDKFRVKKK